MKTILEISSFYTCAKNNDHTRYSSWDMECDRHNFLSFWATFLHFWPTNNPRKSKFWKNETRIWRYHHFTLVYQKSKSHVFFLSFWSIFCPFIPLLTPKIKMWKKCKKAGDITHLHMCTKNEDHMINGSWNIRADGLSFLPFWAIFCPVTLLTTQKIQILKKWKNS